MFLEGLLSRVLVTGGAGFVGSNLVTELLDIGLEVVVLDDLSSGYRSLIDKRAKLVEGSIIDVGKRGNQRNRRTTFRGKKSFYLLANSWMCR